MQRPDMDCYARRKRIYFMQGKGWHGHRLVRISPSPPGANAMSERRLRPPHFFKVYLYPQNIFFMCDRDTV